MDTLLDFDITGRHYHRRHGVVTRHNNKNCKWIDDPIRPCDYKNVLTDIAETQSRIEEHWLEQDEDQWEDWVIIADEYHLLKENNDDIT